jgi:hypothetical protein
MKCGWCGHHAIVLHEHESPVFRRRWVCTPCVGKRERQRDEINALAIEIDKLERGLDRKALPERAG